MKHILFVTLFMLSTLSSMAWDALGHRIVAEVAYQNLNCRARHQVDKALGKRGMVYYSSWADEIKSDTIYSSSYYWHFQNLPSGLSAQQLDSIYYNKPTNSGVLLYALDSIANRIKSGKRDNPDDIKFIVHLMGDLFQPMHMGRPEDRGGNSCKMNWFSQKTNLHAVWDSKVAGAYFMSYREMVLYLNDYYRPQKRELKKKDLLECLHDTYALQNEVYAYQEKGDTNSYHYTYRFRQDSAYQLYCAGIKLAQLLNDIY